MTRVAVIGAGMAGIACARLLADAGHEVIVLDKGRGIGGRMATRRVALDVGEAAFDHGAQYVTAREPGFAAALAALGDAAARWDVDTANPRFVGRPGMSGIVRAMSAGIEVRQRTEVSRLWAEPGGWRIEATGTQIAAERVVLTVPAPQVGALLEEGHPLGEAISAVRMAPCLTLMAAFAHGSPTPFRTRQEEDGPVAWIAQDSSKPGRGRAATAWVAQAGPAWSARYLEEPPHAMVARLLPELCSAIGADPSSVLHAGAHRWRHARVTAPLGIPFLADASGTLHLAGDWCLGARVEASWLSGSAAAQDILARA
jgi:hypothetical protein